ncbi:hypothetical protein D0T51_07660 [Parabacteroides sp. 52]|uniref:FimB/Mfa2 family fimbrial subunit n=1 Tax=unclassified Parabacteroides TaxID=2649774 RepID=UPI0013D348AC|nr:MULTISPECIES: FimB/Mfa2 family fimbrial subunit [unclassified Parabacteroides]MDH6534886.1 hypothetical protein [Parabacteroides sp. PM5-20]NDV55603.1 hypothetical protein [Parabacteroides sp. 52]
MNEWSKYIRYACYGLVLLLTSCIRDGLEECPPEESGKRIRFVYDYNMSYEDLFHRQVARVDLYLFDENGVYLSKIVDEVSGEKTFPKGYTMALPESYNEVAQLVAFPVGLYNGQMEELNTTALVEGKSRLKDLYVRLKAHADNRLDKAIRPLWHGRARMTDMLNDTLTVPLLKNTNRFRIVLQSLQSESEIDVNEFAFHLETANAAYDAYNTPVDNSVWCYQPFFQENDWGGAGGVAEIHTLRLMADRDNMLTIKHLKTGTTTLKINLNKYINALKLQEYNYMSLQEYMDREDEYKLLIFLTQKPAVDPTDPNPDRVWVAAEVVMQPWIDRDHEVGGGL